MIPLVLLPGMMCDARLFGPQVTALSGTHTLQFAPLSGHADVGMLSSKILAHAPPRFALTGLSMGGIVAMEIVRQAPERVERLALMATNPEPDVEAVKAALESQMTKAKAGDLVKVKVMEVDVARKRIGLSMRKDEHAPQVAGKPVKVQPPKPQGKAPQKVNKPKTPAASSDGAFASAFAKALKGKK